MPYAAVGVTHMLQRKNGYVAEQENATEFVHVYLLYARLRTIRLSVRQRLLLTKHHIRKRTGLSFFFYITLNWWEV